VLSSSLTLLFFAVFLTDFLRIRGAAEAAATTLHGGTAEVNGCGTNQCYSPVYGLCFHSTSYECTSLLNNPRPRPQEMGLTRSPTPRPIVHMIKTENPILLQLNNVADNYILSASDRERILSKIEALLDELDESFEVISVKSPGKCVGKRRLQPSLRGGNKRRLNKKIYIPAIVTVCGREDMSDMSRLFILQALRDRLNVLLKYLKSLDAYAFRSVQLGVEELNLANIGIGTGTDGTGTDETPSSDSGTPSYWVWIITVALACLAVGICLLCCICRAGPYISCDCGSCLGSRKPDTNKDYQKKQNQLAEIMYLARVSRYGNYEGVRDDIYGRRKESTMVRRHSDRRRRRHGDWRRCDSLDYDYVKRRRHDESESRNHQNQSQSDRSSRPVATRSRSM
jgi:hypothetical protein